MRHILEFEEFINEKKMFNYYVSFGKGDSWSDKPQHRVGSYDDGDGYQEALKAAKEIAKKKGFKKGTIRLSLSKGTDNNGHYIQM